jgi:hypothetical protein
MFATRMVWLAAALVVTMSVEALAQDEPTVGVGSRVRVSAPEVAGDELIGTVDTVRNDTLVVLAGDPSVLWIVPFPSIAKLEVSSGKRSHAGRGAGIGFLAGLVIGGAIGYASGDENCGGSGWGSLCIEKSELAVAAGLGFGLVGIGIGALVGSGFEAERWAYVPLENIRVGPAPQVTSGLAIWLSWPSG